MSEARVRRYVLRRARAQRVPAVRRARVNPRSPAARRTPVAHDRILASRTGVGAIEAIMQGQRNVMIGVRNNEIVYVPLSEAIRSDKPFDRKLIQVLDELSI